MYCTTYEDITRELDLRNKHMTKNMRGFRKTYERRPFKPGTDAKTCGPWWMDNQHTLDRLNSLKAVRAINMRHGLTAQNYNPKIYV